MFSSTKQKQTASIKTVQLNLVQDLKSQGILSLNFWNLSLELYLWLAIPTKHRGHFTK